MAVFLMPRALRWRSPQSAACRRATHSDLARCAYPGEGIAAETIAELQARGLIQDRKANADSSAPTKTAVGAGTTKRHEDRGAGWRLDGARSRTRTGMPLLARDFKSPASTDFAIRAVAL